MRLNVRFTELRMKEVVNIADGDRYGYVEDIEVDLNNGQIKALIISGRRKLFGILGHEEDYVIPWGAVRRFGEDIILVDREPETARSDRRLN